MARSLSLTARRAIYDQDTAEVFLILLTLSHPNWVAPVRVVHNTQNITSRGNEYLAFPFLINLPDDTAESVPEVTLTIDNVSREIVAQVRSISTSPDVTLEIVLASSPNTLEAGPFAFKLTRVTYNALTVEGVLSHEDILNEPFPGDSITPEHFPSAF